MNTDQADSLLEQDLTERIIGIDSAVYNELGAGFLENIYESALSMALEEAGLEAVRQSPIAGQFRGRFVGELWADILVNECTIVEFQTATRLTNSHEGQLINYLKATGIHGGLLFNFGPQAEFQRRVF